MKNLSKKIFRCQFSKKKDLQTILSLGNLPAVNNLQKISKYKSYEFFFPTNLVYSPSSKLFQIDNVVDKKILFPKSYPYTSSTTKILRDNFKDLSNEVNKILNLNKNDLIIDIGSNDGNLLNNFKNFKILGITPEKIGLNAIKKGIPTIISYFDDKVVKKILKNYGKAKVITATNVFAHIENLDRVLENVLKILDKDGIFITESHYFLTLLESLQYDTIYHEHLRYYTLTSLKIFFEKKGLYIFKVQKIPTHGGSIRVYVSRKKNLKKDYKIKKILDYEKKKITKKNLNKFSNDVLASKVGLLNLLNKLKSKNKTIFGIGAPSRATTLVNYVGINNQMLDCICEISGSYKIGKFLPGTSIPIVNEELIFKKKPHYLLILSWHIYKDLTKVIRKRGYKGKFIIPLPKPRII